MAKPILIIDDEEKFAEMLKELLRLNGFEAEFSLNPEEAVQRMRQEDFDLVITDYKMPQMDGAEFLVEARKINPDLPVIMISGLMNMPELIKVANIGVTLVLEKPFKTEELLEHVSRFVGISAEDASTVEAMDMEASEIDFNEGSISVSYPSPAKYLSDSSRENKRFLETFWNNASTSRHLPFFAQRGAEIRLVAKEVMYWTEQDPEEEVVRIDLVDTKTDFTRSWVLENEPFPGVLVVDIRDCEWDGEAVQILSDWISFVESSGKNLSSSRLLYVLPIGANFDPDSLIVPKDVKNLLATECPVMLSLRERVPDTAFYIKRYFSDEERGLAGLENLTRLLHYPWPGGYAELLPFLGKLRSLIESEGQLSVDSFNAVIEEGLEDPSQLKGPSDLEAYLKRRQREYLTLHRQPGEDLKDTLLRLGIGDSPVDPDAILADEALIYPEIVNQSAE
ncbi:response regulator [Puniceicoccales bacterium CK1056]|uniref:Response regulator n=1 Tax=Oceanipulchritudo coccoides TaxID=2706888 RepID=A0A6B2M0M4_9BACT|nr:response regulator [Oceanipulchritudo coccoides]NDV61325.1 response regulator [Oceanipulchritudo coccoides]